MTGVEVLLWDCDGVLQHGRRDWVSALDAAGGPGFAAELFAAEAPALRGERSLRSAVESVVAERAGRGQASPDVEELLGIWEQVDLDPEAVSVLAEVRALGVRCLLATNQQDHRVRHMREVMGYDDLVDGAYWSCEVGHAKPDPGFFRHVVDSLGVPADRLGFVDDLEPNVTAARAVGLRAVRHDPTAGASALQELLRPLVPGLGP